jgi:hypothetical protein
MRFLIVILLTFWCVGVAAQSSSVNVAIPSSPQSYASDRVRSGTLECSQAIGSATNVEFGVVGVLNQNDPYSNFNQSNVGVDPDGYDPNGFIRDVGVYAKITIPIGKPKERLDCSKLYKLELRARELEIRKLEAEVANLRNLRFTDDGGN